MLNSILNSFKNITFNKILLKLNYNKLKVNHLSQHQILYNMNIIYFHILDDNSTFTIKFNYKNPTYNIDRKFNFNRKINESVEFCLNRIKANFEKEFTKNSKKEIRKNKNRIPTISSEAPNIEIKLYNHDDILTNIDFNDIFANLNIYNNLKLEILNEKLNIKVNEPWVNSIILPTCILSQYLVYPTKLDLMFADKEKSKFVWLRSNEKNATDDTQLSWTEISTNYWYRVQEDDVGSKIKIICVPILNEKIGPACEYVSKCFVQSGPNYCPFENRQLYTKNKLADNQIRIMSYNILADLYADSDYSRKELFPYCPASFLKIDYRKQLFIKEIMGYNSDIICLQEVDSKIFDIDLKPIFNIDNYSGYFKNKGDTPEGIAIFYNNKRFELISTHDLTIGENIDKLKIFEKIYNKIKLNTKLLTRITALSTTVGIVILKLLNSNNIFIICNTHLYFHPDADHIRLLQISFLMLYIENIYKDLKNTRTDYNISIIFCGDFNSSPDCGIYKLMTEKFVDQDFIDWQSNKSECIVDVSVKQPFNIKSACELPKYTNYTPLFKECIDYIFYQTDYLKVERIIPFPSETDLSKNIAIPSIEFPSDHIALIADLKII